MGISMAEFNLKKYDIEINNHFPWGDASIRLKLKRGRIIEARIDVDGLEEEINAEVSKIFTGCLFNYTLLADRIGGVQLNSSHMEKLQQVARWLKNHD